MYKVFVNDIPIILSTEKDLGDKFTSIPIKEVKLKRIIKNINKGKLLYVNLFHRKKHKLLKHLQKKLPVVTAAGGMVFNTKEEVLFIYRNERWDLPKGKVEKHEAIEEAALREVEEETGVKNLQLGEFLMKTYHVFKRNGKYKLKVTHWFRMTTDFEGELVPEEKEDITKVKWKDEKKIKKALGKSYANIRLLFPEELQPDYALDILEVKPAKIE